jgi:hypothetical protein
MRWRRALTRRQSSCRLSVERKDRSRRLELVESAPQLLVLARALIWAELETLFGGD